MFGPKGKRVRLAIEEVMSLRNVTFVRSRVPEVLPCRPKAGIEGRLMKFSVSLAVVVYSGQRC